MRIGCTVKFPSQFLLLCVRIPKSGSVSLDAAVRKALWGRRSFYLPNTVDLDGRVSSFQRLRFQRGQMRNLLSHYRSPRLARAFEHIEQHARPGDVLSGGHIDFQTVCGGVTRDIRILTIIRNPYDRIRSEYFYARQNFLRKSWIRKIDSSLLPQIAASRDFDGYVDFLWDHHQVYGNIAARYLGIAPRTDIKGFFERHVFHAGVLEQASHFARCLQEKMGARIEFPHLNARGSAGHVALNAAAKRKIELIYAQDFDIYEYMLGMHRKPVRKTTRDFAPLRDHPPHPGSGRVIAVGINNVES